MTPQLTPLFDGRGGLGSAREQMTLEFLDGDRPMIKVGVSTKGFNDAFQKATAQSKSIAQSFAAKKCGMDSSGGGFFGLE